MAGPSLMAKKRLLFLLCFFSAAVLVILIRVAWIQIKEGEFYQREAYEQQTSDRLINPKRGVIYDRNMKPLAISASVETISVNPATIRKTKQDAQAIAQGLSEILGMKEEDILTKLKKPSRYEFIKRKVDKEIGDKVRVWRDQNKFKGIYVDEDTKRFYPNENLASHVLGFAGTDNNGLDGIEYMMEKYLKGVPGKIMSEVGADSLEVPFKEEKYIAPQDGLNVVLTIDETIQYLAEKALEQAIIDDNLLNGAAAIVMDPRNGEVLAMASKPDYNPNDPFTKPKDIDEESWKTMSLDDKKKIWSKMFRNKGVVDTYEPGSTFKAVTSAAGLEEGVVTPETRVNDFTITVGGKHINCWKPNFHKEESFTEGVQNSCNPVFVRVSQSLGVDKFYKYVRAFGFYDKTGIDLPGEEKSIFHNKPTELDMAVSSFGQRFQITPIQLITAYGAIANGGKLIKPHVVKELTDNDGNIVKKFEPEVVRNVISTKTADTLKAILESVVSEGTGGRAYVRGYRVAGKTGTSETLVPGRYIASFSAFAPADNPVICVLVILDHPNMTPHTGGMLAAPVAGKLSEDILSYLEVERKYSEEDEKLMAGEVAVPEVRNLSVEEAKALLREKGLAFKVEGSENDKTAVITEQTPKPGATVLSKSIVILYTGKSGGKKLISVPNLLNKTVDEATETLNNLGLNIRVSGKGIALKQGVEEGKKVKKGEIIEVDFGHIEAE